MRPNGSNPRPTSSEQRLLPLLLLALATGSIGGADAACAWSPTGHRVVAQIATDRLGETARRESFALLGTSLAEASTWADEVREDPAWKWLDPYHYVNLDPRSGRFEGCPQRGCVVDGIRNALATLRDTGRPREDRVVALRQLVHFVADLHQPLHVSHAADRGGNAIEVRWFGEPSNLHWVWDTGIVRQELGRSWREIAATLERQLRRGALGEVEAWRTGDVVDWTHETYRLSVGTVYPSARPGARLGREYARSHSRLVETQLAKGGVRLAWLLDGVWP
ncbi:MAG TPA: S1/P1 nuclease [Thermoanaerobaculia bacterium]|nr:S1/P1 nuclease [Thermoanaerobaculia bacterium]